MRVSNQLLTNNFLNDLSLVQQRLAKLQHQSSTGKAFDRPSDAPTAVARSISLQRTITYIGQYNRNAEDGASRLSFSETAVTDTQTQLQRLRELTVQGANTYLTPADRGAIATEINQLLEQVTTISNSSLRGRYVFSGYQSLTQTFKSNTSAYDGMLDSVTYQGDTGNIARNMGIQQNLGVNFTGKQVFMDKTYTLNGRQLSSQPLGYSGTFEVNDRFFNVTPSMTLEKLRDMINADKEAQATAIVTQDQRIVLSSSNSSDPVKVRDLSGSVLEDLGLLPQGAFNLAQTAPTLPLTDSRGALHTSAALVFPLSVGTANQDLVLQLSGAANSNVTVTKALKLDAVTYATSADLAAEIQKKADLAFGGGKLKVNDAGGGVLEIESALQSGTVTVSDLRVGGTADDGTVDTASNLLGFNAVASVQEVADLAGVDGNDRFIIDLGKSAYRTIGDEAALDLPPIEINLDATAITNVSELVQNINDKLLANGSLTGLVEAKDEGGRVRLQSTRQGQAVLGSDFLLTNAVSGAVLPATDTLAALGFYRDPLTGQSAPPVPATVFSTAAFPPGIGAIVAGVNDSFSIDLGPSSSLDGTNPGPVNLTLTAGAYGTAAALAAEINARLDLTPGLRGAVQAVVRTSAGLDYVDMATVKAGSRMQPSDLILSDVTAGALANLGLTAPTTPGGGSADGQGDVELPNNVMDSFIKVRDDLLGYASRDSRLVDLQNEGRSSLGLYAGYKIQISSDGSMKEFTVQRYTTMEDLSKAIEDKLGVALNVRASRNGSIEVFNPTNVTVQGIKVEAFDPAGQPALQFNQTFAGISGNLGYRSRMLSKVVYDDGPFEKLTKRVGYVDDSIEKVLSTLSELGSRQKRVDLTLSQNDSFELNMKEQQTENDFVDMAEVITKLQEQENVLRASLSTGSHVIQPSLFDFLN